MIQKKTIQKQKTDQQPDFFDIVRQEFGNNTNMRFYIQQQNFSFNPFKINGQNKVDIDQSKLITINLPLSRIITNTVTDTLIMNKFVYNNSKICNSLMENGKDTISGNQCKRHLNWLTLLERKELVMVKAAYYSLSIEDQSAIEFSSLLISNLILKLAINTTKLSCILTSKKNASNFVAISTLSILFLQYLMYSLFEGKQLIDEMARSQFLRQLPRVSYIKFSQILNTQQIFLTEIGQQSFFTKHSPIPLRNIQYIQFYEYESYYQMQGNKKRNQSNIFSHENKSFINTESRQRYQRTTHYDYINWINVRKKYGIKAPYGFDILFLFRRIYMEVIKDFNPDVIAIVQDYDNDRRVIQPSIRALLITQLMQNITGKVFVMREVGFKRPQQQIWQYLGSDQKLSMNTYTNNNKQGLLQTNGSSNNQMVDQNSKNIQSSFKCFQDQIMKKVYRIPLMTKQLQDFLNKQQTKTIKQHLTQHQDISRNNPTKIYSSKISKIQQILRDDLSYISLALIQRNNFQTVYYKSHQHIYSKEFLSTIVNHLQRYWLKEYIIPVDPNSNLEKSQLKKKLLNQKKKIEDMILNLSLTTVCQFYQDFYDYVYDLRLNIKVYLNCIDFNHQKRKITYKDQDQVHVYYGKNHTLVFIFKFDKCIVLRQLSKIQGQNIQNINFIIFYEKNFPTNTCFVDSTYVITDNYFFKGFGCSPPNHQIYQNYFDQSNQSLNQQKYSSSILKIKYSDNLSQSIDYELLLSNQQNSLKLSQQIIRQENATFSKNNKGQIFQEEINTHMQCQQLNKCFAQMENQNVRPLPIEIKMLSKKLGWGMLDKNSQNIIFMGGYSNNCVSQNKINKYLHVCNQKEKRIKVTGKTSKQIFLGSKNPKAKIPLYPFIYGIPFIIDNTCYILNTNGYAQSFTNSNKIFLTEFKMSSLLDAKIGITLQRKLYVNYENEQQRLMIVTAKEFIVHYMINSYNMKNVYENRCVLQTLDEGTLLLELDVNATLNGKKIVTLNIQTDKPSENGFQKIQLFFTFFDI